MWYDLPSFYKSKEWQGLIEVIKLQRVNGNGDVICEACGHPIVKAYDCIAHHKEHLTLDNVNDASISLNQDNIALLHFKCHNIEHNRFGRWTRHIYLVYGCPLSGKSSWVKEHSGEHDIICDIDKIYECISNNPSYVKSGRLTDNVFAIRDLMLDMIKARRGKWVNAFVVGGFPYSGERERLCEELGAEPIFIECDEQTALYRLESAADGRNIKEWTSYIHKWFSAYSGA